MLFEKIDGLQRAVFEHRKVLLAESGDGIAVVLRHHHIDDHFACRGFENGVLYSGAFRGGSFRNARLR